MAQTQTAKQKSAEQKRAIMHRTQKWPLSLTKEQESLLYRISDGLREYYNLALEWQYQQYTAYKEAKSNDERQKDVKGFLTAFDCYTRFKDEQRPADESAGLFRAKIPTNWVLETFRQVEGAFKSFFELRKKGDVDARSPKICSEDRFQVILGALGASFRLKGGMVQLAPRSFGGTLCFKVAHYQMEQLQSALRFAKFTIARSDSWLKRPGHLTLSLAYEIEQPITQDFDPDTAVYVALGASSIGVVSPHGEVVIPFRRSDISLKPHLEALSVRTRQLVAEDKLAKGSGKHEELSLAWRFLFRHLGEQQQMNRRRVVANGLLRTEVERPLSKAERRFKCKHGYGLQSSTKTVASGHGIHFVVTELVVRSKPGKLADASKPERGGSLGANWAAQNTGSLAYLVSWLKEKAKEHGGSVRRMAFSGEVPSTLLGDEKKIFVAKALRDQFLRAPESATLL